MDISALCWSSDQSIRVDGVVTRAYVNYSYPSVAVTNFGTSIGSFSFSTIECLTRSACAFLLFTVVPHATVLFKYRPVVLSILVLVVVVC